MALRRIDVYLPDGHLDLPSTDDNDFPPIVDRRDLIATDERRVIQLLVETRHTESVIDRLDDHFQQDDYRLVISEVLATLPRADDNGDSEGDAEPPDETSEDHCDEGKTHRISREEIHEDVKDSISVSSVHFALVALSTIVASAGMIRDSTAVVIGAMVIAPLIGPNIALALSTTLADIKLLRRSLRINLVGLLLGFVLAVIISLIFGVDPTVDEIASRTSVNIGDIMLALAAGSAGVLSVTRGVSTAMIGVMVAVALLPPLAATGMLLAIGDMQGALGAGVLTATNVIAINLAGIATFLIQGIRPTTWHEVEKARRSTIIASLIWITLMITMVLLILFSI